VLEDYRARIIEDAIECERRPAIDQESRQLGLAVLDGAPRRSWPSRPSRSKALRTASASTAATIIGKAHVRQIAR
jgi:hypothetical protein